MPALPRSLTGSIAVADDVVALERLHDVAGMPPAGLSKIDITENLTIATGFLVSAVWIEDGRDVRLRP